jgi:hypothetical protein
MKHRKRIYKIESIVAAVFMIVALLWLTISTPFVYAAEQQQKAISLSIPLEEEVPGSEDSNPFSNTTEEKAESGSGLSEYLHHIHELIHPAASLHKHNCSHDFDVYVAYHGELLCPPPNFILS